MKTPRHFGLRAKLFLAFGIVLLPIFVLLVLGFRWNLALRKSLVLEDQRLTADAVAMQVDGVFDGAINFAWAVSNDPLSQSLDSKILDPHLEKLMELHPYYHMICIFDSKGINRGCGHLNQHIESPFNITDTDYFRLVMATNFSTISEVTQFPPAKGEIGIVAAVPIRKKGGQVIGVVIVAMTAKQLAKWYEEIRLRPGQTIFLTDRNGRLAFHSFKWNISFQESAAVRDIEPVRAALAGISTTVDDIFDPVIKDRRLGAFVPTLRYRWVVGVTMPPSVAFAPAYHLLHMQLGSFIGILVLCAALAFVIARYLARPIRELAQAAQALGRGDLGQRVSIHSGDEIEYLGTSFNEMASQLQQRDSELRKSQKLYRTIVETTGEGIWIVDKIGKTSFVNQKIADMLGYSVEELIGKEAVAFLDEEDSAMLGESLSWSQFGQGGQYDLRFRRKNGELIWVLVTARIMLDDEQNVTGSFAMITDITQRKIYEEQLKHAKDAADAANQAKTQFLANMSHEMRTPLSAIIGFAELLIQADQSVADRVAWIEKISKNGERLKKMMDEILDFSKVEAGKLQVNVTRFSIPEVITQVKSMLFPLAMEKKLDLHFEVEGSIPQMIYSDQEKLFDIFINIIGNAIKFTVKNPITIRAKMISEGKIAFDVKDLGPGLTPEQSKYLFEPFVQADSSMTRKVGGTGLGLVLSRKYAQALGGNVELTSSTPGKGSVFTITLNPGDIGTVPRITSLETVYKREDVSPLKHDVDLSSMQVLVVDDAPDNQFLIRRFLEKAGVHVDLASNGREAVDKALQKTYDVILMDIQMPVLDGYHATSELRMHGYQKPIVALTAHALKEERERCLKQGFTGFLTKPIKRFELFEQLEKFK